MEAALKANAPQGTDATIKKMMENTELEDVDVPSNLTGIKKPKSFNKKKKRLVAKIPKPVTSNQ